MKRFVLVALLITLTNGLSANEEPDREKSDAWTDRISGTVKSMSIATNQDESIFVAVYDDTERVHILRGEHDKLAFVGSTELKFKDSPQLLLSDLDGDGTNEVLVCSDRLRVFTVTEHGPSLVWSSQESFPDSPAPRIGVLDYNGDGRKDLAVLNYKANQDEAQEEEDHSLYLYARTLPKTLDFALSYKTTFTDENGYHSTAGMAIADFTGDAKPEIVIGNDNGFLWLVSFDGGNPVVKKQWQVPSGGAVGPGLSAGNLDGDAACELLVGTNGGDIFVFDLDREFEPKVAATAAAGRLAYGVAAGDVDGDGKQEFVLTRGHLGYAGMTQNDVVAEVWKLEDGRLHRVWRQETLDMARPIICDLNSDRRDDIIVISAKQGELRVLQPRW